MSEPQPADLYVLAEILGHDPDCHSHEHSECQEWCDNICSPADEDCSVWRTARGLLSSANLNRLLSDAWQRGFTACQMRVGNQLLALLPQSVDSSNPYEPTTTRTTRRTG